MSKIHHHVSQQAFVCIQEGKASRLDYRYLDATRVEAYHTEVAPELQGQGIAGRLARHFYDWCQAQGLTIVPMCSYIEAWLRRNMQ